MNVRHLHIEQWPLNFSMLSQVYSIRGLRILGSCVLVCDVRALWLNAYKRRSGPEKLGPIGSKCGPARRRPRLLASLEFHPRNCTNQRHCIVTEYNFSERELTFTFTIICCHPSVCRLSSVTFVRPSSEFLL